MLTGKISREQLYREFPIFREGVGRYVPEERAVEGLRNLETKTEILVFLGTWCSDSVSEVPKFFRVYDTVNNPNLSVELIGVDRVLQDGGGLSEHHTVQRVPTFVLLRNGREVGRVIEHPNGTIEEDLLGLLAESP